ncbi:hypothetical protein B0T26DRAFT_435018 [Lasiosphaeria miniovina]|uniref:Uncharacterized protein n=1 Tax=Lasiosphaeria miniovina TaxID=1954250 RepID=A0AA40A6X4_9PEZI|nr:uncharacterized protein B0T26DRAFT_435018 [Lasiosphaeria miniovina]KAK0710281.1 hypothetical protein B0T26DRAFT_435018 [Lasiosphaeria miniovina]
MATSHRGVIMYIHRHTHPHAGYVIRRASVVRFPSSVCRSAATERHLQTLRKCSAEAEAVTSHHTYTSLLTRVDRHARQQGPDLVTLHTSQNYTTGLYFHHQNRMHNLPNIHSTTV